MLVKPLRGPFLHNLHHLVGAIRPIGQHDFAWPAGDPPRRPEVPLALYHALRFPASAPMRQGSPVRRRWIRSGT